MAAVSRIVLLGAPNRGLRRLPWALRPLDWLVRLVPLFPAFTYQDMMFGSAFVTNLRIDWIRHFCGPGTHRPLVIQLLGARNTPVRASDSRDVLACPFGDALYPRAGGFDRRLRHDRLPDIRRYATPRASGFW